MGFSEIFKDENEYNEKLIIGFMSFAVMPITSIVDMVTGAFGLLGGAIQHSLPKNFERIKTGIHIPNRK